MFSTLGWRQTLGSALALAAITAACAPAPTSTGSTAPQVAPAATVAPAVQAASTAAPLDKNVTLTVYNAQHEPLTKAMTDAFTKETGIKVEIRQGRDFDFANQIVAEGTASPADLFTTENSPAMQVVQAKGMFQKIDTDVFSQVPAKYSPTTGDWMGYAARSTVLVYNPKLLNASQLPKSLMDLKNSEWKDKYGIAPGGADFQAIVSAVVSTQGVAPATEWVKGLKANAKVYSGNGAILRAVNSGDIPAGVIYHYYWYQDRADAGTNSSNTELHFFPNRDPGAFLSISGAGVLKSSKHPREAMALLKFMTGKAGQETLSAGTALEYSIGSGVVPNSKLKPITEINPPDIDPAKLNGPQVIEILQQAGLL